MAQLSHAQEEAIIRQTVQAYQFTPAAIRQAAEAIYTARLTATKAAYQQCAHVAGTRLSHDWQAPHSLARIHAQEAWEHARGIAETYHLLLAAEVKRFLADQPETRSAFSGLRSLAQRLGEHLSTWMSAFLAWKTAQIASVEMITGANLGTRQFLDDLADGTVEVGDGVDENTLYVAVVPENSSPDFCSDYAGKLFRWSDYTSLPEFPAHVGCIHRLVLIQGGLETEL
jgi:hypothetical protein